MIGSDLEIGCDICDILISVLSSRFWASDTVRIRARHPEVLLASDLEIGCDFYAIRFHFYRVGIKYLIFGIISCQVASYVVRDKEEAEREEVEVLKVSLSNQYFHELHCYIISRSISET